MVDLSLSIDRTSLSLADLVFSGANGTAFGLLGLTHPSLVDRTEYATNARFLHGSLATASTWDHAGIGAAVELKAASQAALKSARNEVIAALGRLRFEVTITENSVDTIYQGQRGSFTPLGSIERWQLEQFKQLYNLTIPVHPVPIS